MIYYLFEYLESVYQLPGAGVFQYISFRAALSVITSLLVSMVFGGKIINLIRNKQIGEDISIITFDGPVVESLTNPKLTAISHPLEELGTNAINILLGSKKKKLSSNYLVKPHIIERGSVNSLI